MFVDDLQTSRKVSISLLLVTIQLVIITTFGGGWISGKVTTWLVGGVTLVPYPSLGEWWMQATAVIMYINLAIALVYILWTVGLIVVPDRIPLNLKMTVFVDMIVSGLFTILLTMAYAFFAGGFNGLSSSYFLSLGYCFWFTVIASVIAFASLLVSRLSWLRN